MSKSMQEHINQATHNQALLDSLNTNFPDDYFDWKITLLFYIALHSLHALARMIGRDIGQTHTETIYNITPSQGHPRPTLPIKKDIVTTYKLMKKLSSDARYDGFKKKDDFTIVSRANYLRQCQLAERFRQYIVDERAVPIP